MNNNKTKLDAMNKFFEIKDDVIEKPTELFTIIQMCMDLGVDPTPYLNGEADTNTLTILQLFVDALEVLKKAPRYDESKRKPKANTQKVVELKKKN